MTRKEEVMAHIDWAHAQLVERYFPFYHMGVSQETKAMLALATVQLAALLVSEESKI